MADSANSDRRFRSISQYGLEWVEKRLELEPHWTVDPDTSTIEKLCRQHLQLSEHNTRCSAGFHAQGAFNKLYTVKAGDSDKCIMRVTLPVDPHRKTASEAATIEFVRSKTTAPVSCIIAFDTSNQNELGFEWILMGRMPGMPLKSKWRSLSMSVKEALVRKLAVYQAELFAEKFHAIGNLYHSVETGSYELGSIVSMALFWGDRATRDVPRGPFRNSHEWLSARLAFLLEDQEKVLCDSDNEDMLRDAERAKELAGRLLVLLPQVFPPDETETTMICHDDLHDGNILVNDAGDLTALLDWECVSAVPLWKACQLLALLDGRARAEEPQRETYGAYKPSAYRDDDGDHQGVSHMYWEHLLEYEIGLLRPLFLQEMRRLQPEWMQEYLQGELKSDFELAMSQADSVFAMGTIEDWLNVYDQGEHGSLREELQH